MTAHCNAIVRREPLTISCSSTWKVHRQSRHKTQSTFLGRVFTLGSIADECHERDGGKFRDLNLVAFADNPVI